MGNQLEQTQQPHIHEILNILNVKMKILCFSHCWAGLIKEKNFHMTMSMTMRQQFNSHVVTEDWKNYGP